VDCRLWNSGDFQQEVKMAQLSEFLRLVSMKVALNLSPPMFTSFSYISVMNFSWSAEQFTWQLMSSQKSLEIIQTSLTRGYEQQLCEIDHHQISSMFVAAHLFPDKVFTDSDTFLVKGWSLLFFTLRLASFQSFGRLVKPALSVDGRHE
jgi:hypothetical protein